MSGFQSGVEGEEEEEEEEGEEEDGGSSNPCFGGKVRQKVME